MSDFFFLKIKYKLILSNQTLWILQKYNDKKGRQVILWILWSYESIEERLKET